MALRTLVVRGLVVKAVLIFLGGRTPLVHLLEVMVKSLLKVWVLVAHSLTCLELPQRPCPF
jgi:HEPN domain-containing protein